MVAGAPLCAHSFLTAIKLSSLTERVFAEIFIWWAKSGTATPRPTSQRLWKSGIEVDQSAGPLPRLLITSRGHCIISFLVGHARLRRRRYLKQIAAASTGDGWPPFFFLLLVATGVKSPPAKEVFELPPFIVGQRLPTTRARGTIELFTCFIFSHSIKESSPMYATCLART
jgi:hypothetical protein